MNIPSVKLTSKFSICYKYCLLVIYPVDTDFNSFSTRGFILGHDGFLIVLFCIIAGSVLKEKTFHTEIICSAYEITKFERGRQKE